MKFFNILSLVVVSTTVLISCDTKRNPYFGDDDAQFYVGSVTGDAETKRLGSLKARNQTTIKFTACIKTLAGGGVPSGLRFDVIAGNETQAATTVIEGCLSWDEVHSYDDLNHEFHLRLKRTIISRNDYNGRRNFEIFWNVKTDKFSDNLKNNKVPVRTEDPVENKFEMGDATNTAQSRDPVTSADGGTTTPTNVQPTGDISLDSVDRSSLKTRLVLPNITLTRVKLKQEESFKVDQNLTLYPQHTYLVSADPKYYVNMINNPDQEMNPPGGNYKITLVFMDDPQIDLEKLNQELKSLQSLESLDKSQTRESQKIKLATQVLLSEKAIVPNIPLSDIQRKKILAKVLIPLVHSTVQFVADKKTGKSIETYIDLGVKNLASLDVRSIVAVTVENISTGQKHQLKGHGVGYVKSLLEPGAITLIQSPIEADYILNEYQSLVAMNQKLRPYDLFVKKEKDLAVMSKADIKNDFFLQEFFKDSYPFAKELEIFFDGKLINYRANLLEKAFCDKMFMHDELKPVAGKTKDYDEMQLFWSLNCQRDMDAYIDLNVLDFVENAEGATVTKLGKSVTETISISRNFERTLGTGTVTGTNAEAGGSSEIDPFKVIDLFVPGLLGNIASKFTSTAAKYLINTFGKEIPAGLTAEQLEKTLKFRRKEVKGLASRITSALPSLRMNVGGKWAIATSSSSATLKGAKVDRTSSEKLNINIDSYKINITTRRCAVVSYQPWVVERFAIKHNIKLRSGFIVCSDKAIKPTYVERYYMVNQDCSEKNGTTDCASDQENTLRMILRGEQMYGMFNQLVESTDLEILLSPMEPTALEQKRMHWTTLMDALQTTQLFPGVFAPSSK